eukprot:jgi/Chrzof1/10584/Cz05g04110.t1
MVACSIQKLQPDVKGVWWWSILHMCSQVHVGKYTTLHNYVSTDDFGAATAQLLPTQPYQSPHDPRCTKLSSPTADHA